jgi:putative flippase GtrA
MRLCKFNFVGAIGIGVQFGVLFLLKGLCHVNYLAATAIAVEAAVAHNFIWHERFTWVDRTKLNATAEGRDHPSLRRSLPRLWRFHLANGAVSILGNLALMRMMAGQLKLNYLAANAIAIAVCSLANFLVSELWVFEQEQKTALSSDASSALTQSSAQISHSSFRPAAACTLPLPGRAEKRGQSEVSACPAQSRKKVAAMPTP